MKDSDAMKRLEDVFKSPMLQINLLAAITGACAALMTWIFISMSQGIQGIFYGDSFIENNLKGTDREWMIIFIPALGGLIAGLIIEPIQGEGGDNHFRCQFFEKLKNLSESIDEIIFTESYVYFLWKELDGLEELKDINEALTNLKFFSC